MCRSGASRNTTSGGLSPNNKMTMRSRRTCMLVFGPDSRRVKIPRNLESAGSSAVAATLATVSLIALIFCGGWRDWVRVGAGVRGRGEGFGALAGCDSPDWHA